MHVLLISIAYPPEVRSASLLTYDFATGLRDLGHSVTVMTGFPRYNLATNEPPRTYDADMVEEGIRVIRVGTLAVHKVGKFRRGLGELSLPPQFAAAAKAITTKVDVIEVYSPPLTLALAGWALKNHFGCPVVLNVQDLFPQNAVDLGLVTNPLVLAGLKTLERVAYAASDAITVHSPGNRDFLTARRGQDAAKVRVMHNWVEPAAFAVPSGTGRFRMRYGLDGQFVMLFAGVLGPAQGLDVIVDAAWELRDVQNLKVLLVGDGTEKQRLMERCRGRGQRNVQFEHFVSKDEYPELLAECDAGLVSITARYHTPVVPGKLLGYMAGGKPVIAALNVESDGHNILAQSGAGISVLGDDIGGLSAAMLRMRDDPELRRTMGERGRTYARAHFDRDRCVAQYERLFQHLIEHHG